MAENKKTALAAPEPEDEPREELNLNPSGPIGPNLIPSLPKLDLTGLDATQRALESLGKMPTFPDLSRLPDIASQFAKSTEAITGSFKNLGSIPATTLTTTLMPEARSPSVIKPESQSRQFEELNRKVSETLAEVEKLRGDLANAKQEAADQVAAATKLVDDARKEFATANQAMTKDLGRVRKHVVATDAEVSRSQLKLVETLGLFVAAFGFIALSANALKDVQNGNELSGALLTAAGLIMSFVLALDLIVRRWRYDIEGLELGWKATMLKWLVPQGVLMLFVIGVLLWGANLLSTGNQEAKVQNKPTPTPVVTQSQSPTPSPAPTVAPKGPQ